MDKQYDFRKAFKELLNLRKISKKDISERYGIGYYNISNLQDNWNPRIETVSVLLDALKVSCEDFIRFAQGEYFLPTVSEKSHINLVDAINSSLLANDFSFTVKQKTAISQVIKGCETKGVAVTDFFKSVEDLCVETISSNNNPSKTENETYKSIDLFAGIGGIRLGFDKAFKDRLETVFVSEWDKHAQETYKANFRDPFPINGDITLINEKDIPPFDICLAGFPCQAFSMAGKHQGFNDDYKGRCRGTLFQDVVRICEYHKPKVIFCENVKGLTIHDHGNTFKIIVGAFEQIGYKVFYKVLNSADFGVAQNRERIYLVCFRNDIAPETFQFPVGNNSGVTIRNILEDAPIPARYYLSDVYVQTLRNHRARHESKGHGFGYVIRDLDGKAGTIVCGGMGREGNLLIDEREHSMIPETHIKGSINKENIRKMTPREWARLQGFPDSFRLPLSDTHIYKQMGNSVTVPVIAAIAEKIKELLDE